MSALDSWTGSGLAAAAPLSCLRFLWVELVSGFRECERLPLVGVAVLLDALVDPLQEASHPERSDYEEAVEFSYITKDELDALPAKRKATVAGTEMELSKLDVQADRVPSDAGTEIYSGRAVYGIHEQRDVPDEYRLEAAYAGELSREASPGTVVATFSPEAADGEVELEFKVDGALLAGETVVAFESVEAGGVEVAVHADITDGGQTVLFAYPRLFTSEATLDVVKLEIGPLAAWTPSAPAEITPYVAELHPEVFTRPSTIVETAVAERTFWEKATILHQEANRPAGKAMPKRYSRHYYDMYRLGHSDVAARAIAQPGLLARVVAFKEKFYRTPWSKLADAEPGTLKLAPQPERLDELASDYVRMRPMIFGEAPAFDDIVGFMSELEERVNGAVAQR